MKRQPDNFFNFEPCIDHARQVRESPGPRSGELERFSLRSSQLRQKLVRRHVVRCASGSAASQVKCLEYDGGRSASSLTARAMSLDGGAVDHGQIGRRARSTTSASSFCHRPRLLQRWKRKSRPVTQCLPAFLNHSPALPSIGSLADGGPSGDHATSGECILTTRAVSRRRSQQLSVICALSTVSQASWSAPSSGWSI